MAWQIQEAKNRFSELIERARHEGPQTVTRHGQPVAQVVAIGVPAVAASSKGAPAQRAAGRSGDGFARYLLEVPRGAVLEAPPRRSRKSRLMLGE